MLARLLQLTTIGLLLAACMAGAWGFEVGRPLLGLGLAALILLGHALILAIEFVLVFFINRGDPSPPASPGQLLRAWWGEVWAAALVFGWRQPFFPDKVPDNVERPGRRGVVFIHGFICNRGFWTPWLCRLREEGIPFVAVNLEPVFGPIDAYVPTVEAAVARLEASTGCAPLLVCHSMGGLVARAWLQARQADHRVFRVVTIGSPHHGTWMARFGFAPNTRQMRQHSAWLDALARSEPAARRERFLCYYGHADNIVVPASTAALPGADNRHVSEAAHVDMAFRPELIQEVLELLASRAGKGAGPNSRSPGSTTPASTSGSSRSCS